MGSNFVSELFDDFKLVKADLTQKLDLIQDSTGEERKSAIRQVERSLEEANDLIGQMRIEKENIPSNARPLVNSRIRNCESDIDEIKRKLRGFSADRKMLYGDRYTDDVNGEPDLHLQQRQQLLSGTERLNRSSGRLQDSQRLAAETEDTGAATLANLIRQRETIDRQRNSLWDSEGYVDRSVKTLRTMSRRMATNRIITVAIISVLILLIVAVIFSKFH